MDATIARPSLLSAAKDFIRKSAGTAVLAIAPLAAVSVAPEAEAQAIFSPPSGGGNLSVASGSGILGFFSGSGTFSTSPYLTDGVRLVRNASYIANGTSGGFSASLSYGLSSTSAITPGLALGQSVDFSYDFNLALGSGATLDTWALQIVFENSTFTDVQLVTFATGSAIGKQTGSGTFLAPLNSNDYYHLYLVANVNVTSNTPSIALLMNSGAGQGVTLNATPIPEPSTYAAIFGLGALGLVIFRRSRRAGAA